MNVKFNLLKPREKYEFNELLAKIEKSKLETQ
jgi:hypothetical protein